ncbi:class A sortase [Enterococcus faecium]|uniref:class A sortase n=1 Tax=Enterococcus faecium TaxID=1352 RepID=UPI003515DA5C
MKTWIRNLLLIALVGGVSMAGYTGYQKYKENTFKQAIESVTQSLKVKEDAKKYGDNDPHVTNDLSINQMLSIQKEAFEQGVNKQAAGQVQIPAIGLTLPIFNGANQYTLSLGAATYFYEDATMGKGNYVLAGHNMEVPGVLFSDIDQLAEGETIDLIDTDTIYRYQVAKKYIVPEYFKLFDGIPEEGSFLSLPKKDEKPVITLFTCVYTNQGKERYVVQGKLKQQLSNQ